MHKMVNGIQVPLTEAEIAEFKENERLHGLKMKEAARTKYKRDRAAAYPSIEDQLDKIFHDGLDAWKADIQAIKDQFPKPAERK